MRMISLGNGKNNAGLATTERNRLSIQPGIFYGMLLAGSIILILSALLAPRWSQINNASLEVGDVADQEFTAPYTLTYESALLTEQRRQLAVESVADVFTPLDTSVARVQVERLRTAMAFITTVREDEYATQKQKLDDLAAIEEIQLDRDLAEAILSLSDSRWQIVQQETIRVLEEIMRSTIRSNQVDEARRSSNVLVSLTLPEDQAVIVSNLAAMFVTANSVYDEIQTENARNIAEEITVPVQQTYVAGQTIVPRGAVISPVVMEALQQYELAENQTTIQEILSAVLLTLVSTAFIVTFFLRNHEFLEDRRGVSTYVAMFLIFLIGARLTIPGHIVVPYLYPTMAFTITVAILFRSDLALVSIIPLSVLITFEEINAFELSLFYIFASFFGVLTLHRVQRLSSFTRSGIMMALAGAVMLFLFRVSDPNTDLIGLLTLTGAGLANGLISIFLAILIQFAASQLLDITSPLQLIELSRPDHPLLQFLLRNAPGSYQHSLQVSNLAEQAAERIGADTMLTRVGALYHDCGKALNPLFFIENQVPGFNNPHDELAPEDSSRIIIKHVIDGVELARKYRLPKPIRRFITEHHGTMITRYQYVKAVEAAGGDEGLVDKDQFRYPGPRPQSRETALLMLADSCEARLRAGRPDSENTMRNMIREVIDGRVKSGELDDTNLTINNLNMITEAFVEALRGVYHPRIEYPKLPKKENPNPEDQSRDLETAQVPESGK